MAERLTKCPDCDADLEQIEMIDGTGQLDQHADMRFAKSGAKPSFWMRRKDVAGKVTGRMCPECGRIILYGDSA